MNPLSDYIDELRIIGRSKGHLKTTSNTLSNFISTCSIESVLTVTEELKMTLKHIFNVSGLAV